MFAPDAEGTIRLLDAETMLPYRLAASVTVTVPEEALWHPRYWSPEFE